MRVLTRQEFFPDEVPANLPEDSPEPDFDTLVSRAADLDRRSQPLENVLSILARENAALLPDNAGVPVPNPDDKPLFVVAGQQAGLFGGPLYTFYKALHAIRLARRLENALSRKVVPLFWVASDDHDFAEVSRLGIMTGDSSRKEIDYAPAGRQDDMPVGEIVLDDGIIAALDTLASRISRNGAGERYLALLRQSWKPGERWGAAFARQMAGLLSPYGLVLLDPRWPGMKTLFAPSVQAELERPLESTALVNRRADEQPTARLRKEAIRRPPDATNLFLETDGVRLPLRFDGAVFIAGDSRFGKAELLALAASSPERFSPGAALRPVFQDRLMPVLATIAGPGERVYLEQIEPLYRLFDVPRSAVWPRASFTVVDRKVLRYAEKEGVALPQLFGEFDRIMGRISRETLPDSAAGAFSSLETAITDGFGRLVPEIAAIDNSLVESADRDRGRMLHILNDIRDRAVRAHRASRKTSERRIAAAVSFLMPEGRPQERWYGADAILPVLDEFGFEAFIELTSPGEHLHRIVLPE